MPTFVSLGYQKSEREKGIENIFAKIMTKKFPNLVKEIDIQIQEVQGIPKKMNAKRPTSRHIIFKLIGKD